MTAQPGGAAQHQAAPGPAIPAVICADLHYSFGTHRAVDGVDLQIAAGETFGLLGPNGAGKTTTIRMLTTLLKPDEGTVAVFGVDAAARPMLVRRLIGPCRNCCPSRAWCSSRADQNSPRGVRPDAQDARVFRRSQEK